MLDWLISGLLYSCVVPTSVVWPNAEYELSGTKPLIRICPWLETAENCNDPIDV